MNDAIVYLERESGTGIAVTMTEAERAELVENGLAVRWDCGRYSFTAEAIKIVTGQ